MENLKSWSIKDLVKILDGESLAFSDFLQLERNPNVLEIIRTTDFTKLFPRSTKNHDWMQATSMVKLENGEYLEIGEYYLVKKIPNVTFK